ncbi:attacin-E [Manduca sexta]|uniref:Attacin C-terminal domain-containing protein n=1 Tax=Manduca sexta TaxID=7130 RepID=A0A921ZE18_MANSE|nr:attacin-E [Manduca sexta]KAG6456236.1 hypothetical protein O3G_MSEX009622 [Manduca sexta]KAG6456237.1 hypothetical protein O3G_MSEX009622 [Manduca sexta]
MCVKVFLILGLVATVLGHNEVLTNNGDGSIGGAVNIPVIENDNHAIHGVGALNFDKDQIRKDYELGSATAGVAYSNAFGHGVSLTETHVPGFGDKLTAAGKLNVFHNDNHNVDVNAFATRTMPDIPRVPDFNTVGGGVDYTFKDKVGASASMAHSDFIDRNDYSVAGRVNLMSSPRSSLDFSAGYEKFTTPFVNSGWKPKFSFSYNVRF